MAKLITLDNILPPNSDYPLENIIVDTNIIIDYKDPFGRVVPQDNIKTVEEVNKLKSHYKVNSTIVSGLEYYKYLYVNFYNIFIKTHNGYYEKYSSQEFKKQRRTNSDFASEWDLRLNQFKITFKRHFPPIETDTDNFFTVDNIDSFDGSNVDFGDEMLYKISQSLDFPLIITKDRDFSSFPDDLYIIYL